MAMNRIYKGKQKIRFGILAIVLCIAAFLFSACSAPIDTSNDCDQLEIDADTAWDSYNNSYSSDSVRQAAARAYEAAYKRQLQIGCFEHTRPVSTDGVASQSPWTPPTLPWIPPTQLPPQAQPTIHWVLETATAQAAAASPWIPPTQLPPPTPQAPPTIHWVLETATAQAAATIVATTVRE